MTLPALLMEHWAILMVGLGVGTLAFLVGRSMIRADRADKGEDSPAVPLETLEMHCARDRRFDLRRRGNPIEVDLFDPLGKIPALLGNVVDRSRGGIALLMQQELPIGLVVNARPRTSSTNYSVPVEVRSCRRNRDGWVVGCQFQQIPPWNVLLLFG